MKYITALIQIISAGMLFFILLLALSEYADYRLKNSRHAHYADSVTLPVLSPSRRGLANGACRDLITCNKGPTSA